MWNFVEGGLNFPVDFVPPVFRHVAVTADRPNTGTVVVMYGLCVLLVNIVFHDMTRNTETFGIRKVQCRIKPAPEYDASDEHQESAGGNSEQVFHGWLAP